MPKNKSKKQKDAKNYESKLNEKTRASGLMCDVNAINKNMREMMKKNGYTLKQLKDGELTTKLPIISGADVAITALLQKLLTIFLTKSLNYSYKGADDLYHVDRRVVKVMIAMDPGLKRYYGLKIAEDFKKNTDYTSNIPIIKQFDVVREFVNSDIKLSDKAKNLICFMLHETYTDIVSTGHKILEIARGGKGSFTDGLIRCACRILLSDDTIAKELDIQIKDTVKKYDEYKEAHKKSDKKGSKDNKKSKKNTKSDEESDNDDDSSDTDDSESEEEETKKTKGARSTNKTEISDVSSSGSDFSSDEGDEASESDDEQPKKKKKSKKNNKSKGK